MKAFFKLSSVSILFITFNCFAGPYDDGPSVEELKWVDEGYLTRQRELVDELSRLKFGERIRGNISDLETLQRILDAELVNQTETKKLQALGVVLGDVFTSELKMQWRVYTDEDGKSRAVCIKESIDCIFPITMISKRVEIGVIPDVKGLYEKAANALKPLLR